MSSPTEVARRYRCTACGNLTRFEVTTTRRTRSFHHFTIGGDLTIEDTELLAEDIESVLCRWCGTGDAVEQIPANEVASDAVPADSDATGR